MPHNLCPRSRRTSAHWMGKDPSPIMKQLNCPRICMLFLLNDSYPVFLERRLSSNSLSNLALKFQNKIPPCFNTWVSISARLSAAQAVRSKPSTAGCTNRGKSSPVRKVLAVINSCWEMLIPFLPGDTDFLRLGLGDSEQTGLVRPRFKPLRPRPGWADSGPLAHNQPSLCRTGISFFQSALTWVIRKAKPNVSNQGENEANQKSCPLRLSFCSCSRRSL